MTEDDHLISPTDFAREINVTKQAVFKAIDVGRVPVYDATGSRVASDFAGRRLVRRLEARAAFATSRARVDDATLAEVATEIERDLDPETPIDAAPGDLTPGAAPRTLLTAKTSREELQADLLRIRLAKERGELISKIAVVESFETAGRKVQQSLQQIVGWAEELHGVSHTGGVTAVAAWLRAKQIVLGTEIADAIAGAGDEEAETDDESGADEA